MKPNLIMCILAVPVVMLIVCVVSVVDQADKPSVYTKSQIVDLPEEYQELSHDSAKPDTVLAFYDNDTVYVQFKSK